MGKEVRGWLERGRERDGEREQGNKLALKNEKNKPARVRLTGKKRENLQRNKASANTQAQRRSHLPAPDWLQTAAGGPGPERPSGPMRKRRMEKRRRRPGRYLSPPACFSGHPSGRQSDSGARSPRCWQASPSGPPGVCTTPAACCTPRTAADFPSVTCNHHHHHHHHHLLQLVVLRGQLQIFLL